MSDAPRDRFTHRSYAPKALRPDGGGRSRVAVNASNAQGRHLKDHSMTFDAADALLLGQLLIDAAKEAMLATEHNPYDPDVVEPVAPPARPRLRIVESP